jgi:hypothetical protein
MAGFAHVLAPVATAPISAIVGRVAAVMICALAIVVNASAMQVAASTRSIILLVVIVIQLLI